MIGDRLRDERKRFKLNQTQSGELCGVQKQTFVRWELGDSFIPADKLALLGENGFDVLYIVTGRREPEGEVVSDLTPRVRRFVDAIADRIVDRLLKNKIIKNRIDD
jgi:transcriptional regulator with XRE-family HTH domain